MGPTLPTRALTTLCYAWMFSVNGGRYDRRRISAPRAGKSDPEGGALAGLAEHLDGAVVGPHDRRHDGQARGPCRWPPGRSAGSAPRRPGRTARRRAPAAPATAPGPVSATSTTARLPGSLYSRASPTASGGVCTSALVIRLPITCRSRASSPYAISVSGSSRMSSSIVAVRRDRLGGLHRVHGQHRQLHRRERDRPLPVQPGQQQQVLDQQPHPGRLVLDPADQLGRRPPGSATAPWRYSSANPRMVVSGVRSSCEASATNCRIFSSERTARASETRAASAASRAADSAARAAVSDCARAVKAASIWASIAFSARDSRPSSVLRLRAVGLRIGHPPGQVAGRDRRRGLLDLHQRDAGSSGRSPRRPPPARSARPGRPAMSIQISWADRDLDLGHVAPDVQHLAAGRRR